MLLTLDIETLPATDENLIAEIAATVKAPGQYKKAESIAEWFATEGAKAINEAIAKTSFDGLYGSIACICYAFDDGEVFSVDCNSSGSEKAMLEHFYSHVFDMVCTEYHGGIASQNLTVCGHNVAGFDLPFLKHRSIILGVKPPPALLKSMSAKPWDNCIADTLLMWSSDSQKRVSMDKLCKAFGLAGKGDFDGSMVAETWPIDPQKVIDYCKADVERTRAMYKRLTFASFAPVMELAA